MHSFCEWFRSTNPGTCLVCNIHQEDWAERILLPKTRFLLAYRCIIMDHRCHPGTHLGRLPSHLHRDETLSPLLTLGIGLLGSMECGRAGDKFRFLPKVNWHAVQTHLLTLLNFILLIFLGPLTIFISRDLRKFGVRINELIV